MSEDMQTIKGVSNLQEGGQRKMTAELKEIIKNNISYFATSSTDGKPNVVQVGLVDAISDTELVIVDILFRKTRKNLEGNPHVALGVMDMGRLRAYQLKGKAEIITEGDMFNKAIEIMQQKGEIRKKALEGIRIESPELKDRLQRLIHIHEKIRKPKAVVLMKVGEIYSTWPGETYGKQ